MMLTLSQLMAATGASSTIARAWLDAVIAAAERYEINTPRRLAAFLSEMGHETLGLSCLAESFNYTPEAILATFNTAKVTRFTREEAIRYGRIAEHLADQHSIACIAYANRMGNGPKESGDGWKYRGRGPGQLTGKENIARCGAALGIDLLTDPSLLERPDIGALSFAWFWVEGNPRGINLNTLADAGDIDGISDIINIGRQTVRYGDANGFADRARRLKVALAAISTEAA